jgi:hypothetical protein
LPEEPSTAFGHISVAAGPTDAVTLVEVLAAKLVGGI